MNELRMYVEHLFQGKVLTAENIELKEEIYGNLVARYEDLLSEGVDETEALRRTKESFTSLDDVFAEEPSDVDAASDGGSVPVAAVEEGFGQAEGAGSNGDVATAAQTGTNEDEDTARVGEAASTAAVSSEGASAAATTPLGAAATIPLGVAAAVEPGATRPGGPTPVAEPPAATLHPQPEQPVERRRVWPLVLLSVVGILIFFAIGIMGCNMMAGISSLEHYTSAQDESIDPQGSGGNDQVASGSGTATPAIPSDEGVYVDPNGPVYFDGEPADELVRAVVGSSSNDVLAQSDASMNDVDTLNTLIFNLPMGEWAANLDVTRGNGVLRFDYVRVPDYFDGDSIDLALAYNVTALFCAVPDAQKIQVTVSESDEVNEHDCYVFDRAAVEEAYGVPLDASMVNEAGWGQLKGDNLYRNDFAEHMVDRAERDAR